MTGKEEQFLLGQRSYFNHRTVRNHGEAFGSGGVDQVGITAADSAQLFRARRGPNAGGNRRVEKAEGAGGQELLR